METKKKFEIENLTFPIMGAIVLIGAMIFLFSKDNGVSGWDTLGLQGAAFWVVALLATAGAVYLGYRLYLGNKNETWSPGVKIACAIIVLILLISPWGRACTDKTNRGVTAPGYEPTSQLMPIMKGENSFNRRVYNGHALRPVNALYKNQLSAQVK